MVAQRYLPCLLNWSEGRSVARLPERLSDCAFAAGLYRLATLIELRTNHRHPAAMNVEAVAMSPDRVAEATNRIIENGTTYLNRKNMTPIILFAPPYRFP